MNTQVDASHYKLFVLDNHLLKKVKRVGWLSFPEIPFPVGVPLPKEFHRGELHGREPFSFPLDSRLSSGSCFIPHFTAREH